MNEGARRQVTRNIDKMSERELRRELHYTHAIMAGVAAAAETFESDPQVPHTKAAFGAIRKQLMECVDGLRGKK